MDVGRGKFPAQRIPTADSARQPPLENPPPGQNMPAAINDDATG
jgi:hypothetical protein